MNKIFISVFASVMLFASTVNAQFEKVFNFSSSNQQIIQTALEGAFVKVERSYRIQDLVTGQLFGLNGGDIFGTAFCLAIKAENGLLLSDQAIEPWLYDSNYNKIKESYGTLPYKVTIKDQEKEYVLDSLSVISPKEHSRLFYHKNTDLVKDGALPLCLNVGEIDGWLVWVTENENTNLNYTIVRHKQQYVDENSIYSIETPNISQKIVGGAFVTYSQSQVGTITFQVAGVIVPDDRNWALARVFNPSSTDEKEKSGVNITPIEEKETSNGNKNNKEKKRKQ